MKAWILFFILVNILLIRILHPLLFQSSVPWLGWLSIWIHIVALVFFPYRKIFKTK